MSFIANVNRVYLEIDRLLLVAQNVDKLTLSDTELRNISEVQNNLANILAVSAKEESVSQKHIEIIDTAVVVANNLASSLQTKSEIDNLKQQIDTEHNEVNIKHGDVVTLAQEVAVKNTEIKNLSTRVLTLAMGEASTIEYNTSTGLLTIGIPRGDKGEPGSKGEAFSVDIFGLAAGLSNYDSVPRNTSYLAVDTSTLYFKISDTLGDWSAGVSFGKGDKGADADALVIDSIADNGDGTFTWHFSDGTDYITSSLKGEKGDIGAAPEHELIGASSIRFKNPDGSWGTTIDLAQYISDEFVNIKNRIVMNSVLAMTNSI